MRQTRARILSLLLALVMCLGLLPVTAMAVEYVGSNPGYIIVDAPDSEEQPLTIYKGVTELSTNTGVYHITFDANGGKFPDGSTTKNLSTKKVGEENLVDGYPPEPTREGYTFEGWYRNSPGEYPSVFNYNFTADSTVYASWKKNDDEGTSGFTITFDANGGSVTPETAKTNANGKLQIPLPTATKPGYELMGWYDDGALVYDSTIYKKSTTLVAYWYKPYDPDRFGPRVDFFVNGGTIKSIRGFTPGQLSPGSPLATDEGVFVESSVTNGMIMADASGKLDCFPEVTRSGYTFDGWYATPRSLGTLIGSGAGEFFTDFSGCEKVSLSTVYSKDTCLIARWTKDSDTCTVTFNLNGATGTAPEPQKVAKGKTVELPVLKASNAEFKGWGYTTDGKSLIEWKAEYPVTSDLTLYAIWDVESDDAFSGLTYRFGNYHEAFGYTKPYYIPKERYQLVFGDNKLAETLYDNAPAWGGNCFGMSTTSSMFYVDNDINTTAFNRSARVPYDLATGNQNSAWNNMTVREFIEAMQISQRNVQMRSGLSSLVSAVQSSGSSRPVIVGITGPQGGHAVVGYAVKSDTSTQSRLMIYDPNYPNQEKYITLYKNGSNYTGWYYYLGKDANGNDMNWGSDYNGTIAYLTYGDYYQLRNSWAKNISTVQNLLFLNVENATIKDDDGKTVATITNGEVSTTRSDVYPMNDYGILLNSAATSTGTAIWLPSDEAYTVTTASNSLEATMVNVDQSVTVSTAAKSITFAVNDDKTLNYVQIDQAGVMYDITLSSTLDQGHSDVQLTGITASGGVSLAQISGNLYATGVDSGAILKVDGKNAAISSLSSNMPDIGNLGTAKPTGTNPFTDVKAGAYYYDAVLWAVEKKVTSGTSATTFSPDTSCTRGQIVTFLWRAAGSPKPTSNTNPFTDVKEGSYYYDAVLWAVEQKITSGTSATTFSPDASCTRGQTVTFLYRAAGSPKAISNTNPFTDVKSGAYYYDAVLWAVEQKVTSGTSATTFSPEATVTRGQTVTFLYRSQN